ncbi:MAG: family 78 glycoside hydrolase catalytic domain [Victivallales bacterium]|nr:family 78 glycoside hydrolase catalytic domain [Victivallales bacterium]
MLDNLRVEYKVAPLGMDEARPRFSWETSQKRQCEYRIVVNGADGIAWDSGCVKSQDTAQIEYSGATLQSFTRYEWSVTTKGEDGEELQAASFFETGFMGAGWTAPWIQPTGKELNQELVPVRAEIECGNVASARFCITALGIFKVKINGTPVGEDDLLPPGFTQYDKRVLYRVYDIDGLLAEGKNTLDIMLANGWFSGRISRLWNRNLPTWGNNVLLRCEIRLQKMDGNIEIVPLNSGNTKYCPTNDKADIYDGTTIEAWHSLNQLESANWGPVKNMTSAEMPVKPRIEWSASEPVAHIVDVKPISIKRRPNGAYIVDFGQNLVGREQFTLHNNVQGTMITVRHGEMLRADGSLYYDNLRSAVARTIYVSGENETETFEPEFTFYGFRYLDVTGWPGELTEKDIKARVIQTKLPDTGHFTSSNEMLNKLQSNIIWGQRGNYVDIPTDCPQRDERLGWTGDTQVFADEATWNMDAASFYTKWLADLNVAQAVNGSYANVIPSPYAYVGKYDYNGATGWSDAGIVCPWVLLEKYGDSRIVKKYMSQMLRWLDWEIQHSGNTYILDVARYGDWLYIGFDNGDTVNMTPKEFLSSAYLAGMLRLVAKMLRLVGDEKEAQHRELQYNEARQAIQRRFLDKDGKPLVCTQTALLMALHWDLFDSESASVAAEMLIHNIRDINGGKLTTGFLGTPLLLETLVKIGQVDLAYDLLLQEEYPGWMYSIRQGATTMWERWNSFTKENGFGNVSMNSFNHYAYGAVGSWFYRRICGIQPLSEQASDLGFARFRLAPLFGARLDSATAEYKSIRGMIRSSWKRLEDGKIEWEYTVPPNTTAEIVLPGRETTLAGPGTHRLTCENLC